VSTRFRGRARTYSPETRSTTWGARRGAGRQLRALQIVPDDARVLGKLGLTEVRLGFGKTGLARLAIEGPHAVSILRAESIRAHRKQRKAAGKIVDRGLQIFLPDQPLLEARAE